MNERTKTGLEILQAAILLGVLGDVLLRATPWGLNVLLFIGALVAAMAMLFVRRKREFWNAQTIALNGALIFLAAMFVWRDSAELKILDSLAILTILAILTLPALGIKTQIAGVFHYIVGFVWSGISVSLAPFFLIFGDVEWKNIPQTGWKKHLVAVLRGLAIAVPLLLVFGALFVAADAVYQGIVERTFNVKPEIVVGHIFFVGLFAWITAGYLRGSLFGILAGETGNIDDVILNRETPSPVLSVTQIKDEDAPKSEEKAPEKTTEQVEKAKKRNWQNFDNSMFPKVLTLGAVEISVILGLINLLFLSFVIVQIPYLFGGFEFVQNTPDFKLADYARRGFGELVTVAALVVPILLVSHWLLRKDSPINEKIYRVLAGIQIILLFVIMASAAQRLFILTGNLGYGLTTVRFYPMVCMIWLAMLLAWFAVTVLRGARERFAWGALWSAVFVLAALHFVNPDAYIVRTNVRLMQEGRIFDAQYNSNLSDDAAPVLLDGLNSMNFEQKCRVERKLLRRWEESQQENDFRSWNWSRRQAQNLTTENAGTFDVSACPNDGRDYNHNDDF